MFRRIRGHVLGRSLLLSCVLGLFVSGQSKSQSSPSGQAFGPLKWESKAQLRQILKSTPGDLVLGDHGIEFRPVKGSSPHWTFVEIQTFTLTPRRLVITGYENRKWHLHGERSFSFDLETAMPPAVAADLARRVGKPVENADPDLNAPAFATLAARHRTRGGGTNGTLRFRATGIDYVTSSGHGARSWRWSDIQTLANPDAWHFRVGAYRETFNFELKQPMSKGLFDRLWDYVYARDLSGLNTNGGTRP
jgi:hypothetical protein